MPNFEGQPIADFVLHQRVGQGGLADVYKAWDDFLSRWVAIKVLHKGLNSEYLLKEARIIASLKHANIIPIYSFDYTDVLGANNRLYTLPFYVMQYARGSLADRHPYGERLPADILINYMRQIVDGLAYIHAMRDEDCTLVHLDIKPSNILVGMHDEIIISDFDTARYVSERYFSQVTSSQVPTGTTIYMAPEQFYGQPCPASDQYALGVMSYEWLTGRPPFRGSRRTIKTQKMQADPLPLRAIVPDILPAVEQVVLKALRRNPYSRYANVYEFYEALENAIGL